MTKFLIKNRPEYNISENFQYNGSLSVWSFTFQRKMYNLKIFRLIKTLLKVTYEKKTPIKSTNLRIEAHKNFHCIRTPYYIYYFIF